MFLTRIALSVASTLVAVGTVTAQSRCTLAASGGDDAPALLRAVRSCTTTTIPKGTTLNIGTRMNMTGLTDKRIQLEGTLRFDPDIPYWTGVGLNLASSSPRLTSIVRTDSSSHSRLRSRFGFWEERILYSQEAGLLTELARQAWYDAFASNSTLLRPIVLTIFQASNVLVEDITYVNGPEWHNLVNEANGVVFNNIRINAGSTSSHTAKNTDGWNIYRSDDVTIRNSVIVNGDDCVAFKPNATNVLVENLDCTGSHGISVGSLGQFPGMFDVVQNVLAKNIKMSNAQNGARIKAWAGPNVGSGIVQNITFDGFVESKVDNPVVIDQCYMTDADACAEFPSNTFIQDIVFRNISGTSTGSVVANLKCSPDGRCTNIEVDDFSLSAPSGNTQFSCSNVVLTGTAADLFPECSET
ncbi:hypothetical protein D9756_005522 [Leucocoprinus leucothites]|uniref:galacturonan 1,4-alpha-galacturonidase n=1 Tax=Leucocoprinus leucothites TaxID=201217 RepID=A0A8H5D8Z8_9AGAR|nr:hypothetical protein D9756_005522 [Leucoagaricus leucothites]